MVMVPLSGHQTLESIEKALRQVGRTVDRLNTELNQANQDKAKLVAKRLDAFHDLSKFRTKLAIIDGVIDHADLLSAQLRSILQARHKTLKSLKLRANDAEKERAKLVASHKKLNEEIEQLDSQLDAIGQQAKDMLSDDPAYHTQADHHAELLSMTEKASQKADKARAEKEQKSTPYHGDPLFMYLWKREFLTSSYDRTGLIRFLDRWVARLIRYQDARPNYVALTQIPERLDRHVDRLNKALQNAREALDKMEAEKVRELAGADLLDKFDALEKSRIETVTEMERLNAELLETGRQTKTYAEGLDPSFKEAVEKMTHFLEGQPLHILRRQAQETPDFDDDELVRLIEKLGSERDALEDRARSKREALEAAFKRKEELLRIAAEFRRERYDRPDSTFEIPGKGEALLQLLLQGAITAAEYWLRTQSQQRWRHRPGDGYRRRKLGGFGSKRHRSGSDGPDFSTGGGF